MFGSDLVLIKKSMGLSETYTKNLSTMYMSQSFDA